MNDELQSVRQALRVLRALGEAGPLGVTELGSRLDLSTSTAHRLVKTLAAEHAVVRTVGGRTYELARGVTIPLPKTELQRLVEIAPPVMRRLRDATGETVHIAVLAGAEITYVACVESTRQMRVASRSGERAPAHLSAAGKVLLSRRPQAEVLKLFPQKLESRTEHSITTRDGLLAEVARARADGYARNISESELGMYALAVPVSTPSTSGMASLTVSGPAVRIQPAPPGSPAITPDEQRLLGLLTTARDDLETLMAT